MDRTRWTPLLAGEEAMEASRAIREIARMLAERRSDPFGHASAGLLHAYLGRAYPEERHEEAAAAAIDRAIDAAATTDLPPLLFGGSIGVGWAIEHLHGDVPTIAVDTNDSIDEAIASWLDPGRRWRGDYDLLSGGLVGLGVYALERLPHPAAMACLERVIDRLADAAERQGDGVAWRTPPELLLPDKRLEHPGGYYNLGIAHGVPAVIALLGQAYAAGIERVRPLLDGAVRWLLRCKRRPGAGSVFPPFVDPGSTELRSSRAAWCYGDPGVAIALFGAGLRAAEPHWQGEALWVAHHAARRPPEDTRVNGAGMCHGTAGLGHIFNRLFQATRDPVFGGAARWWFKRTLALRSPGHGPAGYPVRRAQGAERATDPHEDWIADPCLLTGVTGIALALLAAISNIEPRWDRMFLTNL